MLENLKQNKLIIFLAIILVIGVIFFIYNKDDNAVTLEENIMVGNYQESKNQTSKEEKETEDILVVHVTGEVKNPRNCKT